MSPHNPKLPQQHTRNEPHPDGSVCVCLRSSDVDLIYIIYTCIRIQRAYGRRTRNISHHVTSSGTEPHTKHRIAAYRTPWTVLITQRNVLLRFGGNVHVYGSDLRHKVNADCLYMWMELIQSVGTRAICIQRAYFKLFNSFHCNINSNSSNTGHTYHHTKPRNTDELVFVCAHNTAAADGRCVCVRRRTSMTYTFRMRSIIFVANRSKMCTSLRRVCFAVVVAAFPMRCLSAEKSTHTWANGHAQMRAHTTHTVQRSVYKHSRTQPVRTGRDMFQSRCAFVDRTFSCAPASNNAWRSVGRRRHCHCVCMINSPSIRQMV